MKVQFKIQPSLWVATFVAMALTLCHCNFTTARQPDSASSSFGNVVRQVQPRVVKIIGSGGVRGWERYQSGFCISEDGYVLTSWSYVLESDTVSVTLDDGQKYSGELVGYDPRLEIAVLKIDTNGLSHFKLNAAVPARLGARVLAFSNLYGVATGADPVSVQMGVIAGKTRLASRRGAFKTAYDGEVYLVDAITNNPGANGGVICDRKGRLIGMIGKEFVDSKLDTWLNYAIPIDALADSVAEIRSGSLVVRRDDSIRKPSEPMTLDLMGVVLMQDVVDRTPPFVDRIVAGTAADFFDLRPDDLLISINDQLCPSVKSVNEQLEYVDRDSKMKLSLRRAGQFMEIYIDLNEAGSEAND